MTTTTTLTCVRYIDDEPCGNDAELKFNFPLCPSHWREYHQSGLSTDSAIRTMLRYYELEDFPGYCYFMLLPTGRIKIGFSSTTDTLATRFRDLNREIGPIVVLAVCRGGYTAERHFHGKFRAYRDFIAGSETFEYTSEIADTINEIGIHPEAQHVVDNFRNFVSSR